MVHAGELFGRWRVDYVLPTPGRYADGKRRERARVTCQCGYSKIVWSRDLTLGRSRGCPSKLCLAEAKVAALQTLGMSRQHIAEMNREARRRRVTVGSLAREKLDLGPTKPHWRPKPQKSGELEQLRLGLPEYPEDRG